MAIFEGIEEVTEKTAKKVKKNPLLFIGGGIMVIGGIYFLTRPKGDTYIVGETYPEGEMTVGQTSGAVESSGDMSDIVDLLFALAEENTANMGALGQMIGDGLYSQSNTLADLIMSNNDAIFSALSQQANQPYYMTNPALYLEEPIPPAKQGTAQVQTGLGMDDYFTGTITLRDLAENFATKKPFETSASRGESDSYGNDIIVYSYSGGQTTLKDLAKSTEQIAEASLREVTGKQGNLEQQLAGMSQEEKLTALKASGLIT